MSAEHVESAFEGAGGVRIFWQSWLPRHTMRAVLVLSHGVSEHSGRYAHVAERLAEAGYGTYAPDHRGHGRSGGERVMIDRFSRVVADLDQLVDLARNRHPATPLFLIGHSMGGGIAIEYALEHEPKLDGLILSGPLSNGDAANAAQRLAASVLSRVAPKLGVFPVDSSAVSRDPEVVRAYEDDPLVDRRKIPARTVAELTSTVSTFGARVDSLSLPVLLMHGNQDRLVPFDGSERLYEQLGSTDKTFERYDGLHHEILNEPEQERVIDDIVRWLDAHSGTAAGAAP